MRFPAPHPSPKRTLGTEMEIACAPTGWRSPLISWSRTAAAWLAPVGWVMFGGGEVGEAGAVGGDSKPCVELPDTTQQTPKPPPNLAVKPRSKPCQTPVKARSKPIPPTTSASTSRRLPFIWVCAGQDFSKCDWRAGAAKEAHTWGGGGGKGQQSVWRGPRSLTAVLFTPAQPTTMASQSARAHLAVHGRGLLCEARYRGGRFAVHHSLVVHALLGGGGVYLRYLGCLGFHAFEIS